MVKNPEAGSTAQATAVWIRETKETVLGLPDADTRCHGRAPRGGFTME